jgi:CheY-like chemotaxis protein
MRMPGKKLSSVLLVDDDKITNFINQRLILKSNVTDHVTILSNGKEAIDYLRNNVPDDASLPDLILLDINMPVMDGFEFIDSFKAIKHKKKVTIVMLTTSSNEKDIEKISYTAEISGYINKPLTEQKLNDVFVKYIHVEG